MHLKLSRFSLIIMILCLSYLGFELLYNAYTLITVDEFWFAHRAYQYKSGLPYKDFSPYKTVLGYYLLLFPMLFTKGIITTLITIKNFIAILNVAFLLLASVWMQRLLPKRSVIFGLLILLTSQVMLFYSTDIRVDLFGYWLGLFSLLAILEKRYILAGILLGLGFCFTQKVIWYWFASDAALGIYWLLHTRDFKTLKHIVFFNLSALAIVTIYLFAWSMLSSWHIVYQNMFIDASAMYKLDWYDNARYGYWRYLILRDPFIFLLWPISFITLFITHKHDEKYWDRFLIIIYALMIWLCLLPYKQIFPYYLQVIIPITFVFYSALFSWLMDIIHHRDDIEYLIIDKLGLNIFLSLYSILIISVKIVFDLPAAYLLILSIPLLVSLFFTTPRVTKMDFTYSLSTALILTAIIFPFRFFVLTLQNHNGDYQKANLMAMMNLLDKNDDYLAGIELFYDKNQPIPGMRHLMGPAIAYLYQPTKKLRAVMLDSLYEDPTATPEKIIHNLDTSNVKLYVNNYRLAFLPPSLLTYLQNNFQHYWGSIYLYAPSISAGTHQMALKFTGKYRIESNQHEISINHKMYNDSDIIYLTKGSLLTQSKQDFKLQYIPHLSMPDKFRKDDFEKFLF